MIKNIRTLRGLCDLRGETVFRQVLHPFFALCVINFFPLASRTTRATQPRHETEPAG